MHKPQLLPQAFADLGIETPFLRSLEKMDFIEPTAIQSRLIPPILAKRDVLGQARTGTGKTAAFGLPILQMIEPTDRLQCLVLVPTRELAVQVAAELRRLAAYSPLHVVPVYGGQRIKHQLHLLGKRPHVVVGTPGRVIDLLGRGALPLEQVRFAVLDEVDRMLDIGFREDIRRILSEITSDHQTVFVSATLTDEIKRLARRYTSDPLEINVSQDKLTVDHVQQAYVTVDAWDKFHLLRLLLAQPDYKLTIVFCNTKHAARRLAKRLHGADVNAKEIHGDLVQQKRERVMDRFRKHKIGVLVATDLAARGIDVQGITHIVNYDIPEDPHVYVHRIGRTARMGHFGEAVTFVSREEGKQLTEIEKLINAQIPQIEVKGFVPRQAREDQEGLDEVVVTGSEASMTTDASFEKEPAVSSRSRGLGGKFKPARRRRRL